MGRLRTRSCIVVSVRCKNSPELGAWSPAGEKRDAVAILVVNEAEERADGTGQKISPHQPSLMSAGHFLFSILSLCGSSNG
jgi:hypothetical protein